MPDVLVLGGVSTEEDDGAVPDQVAYGVPYVARRGYRPLATRTGRWILADRLQRRIRPATRAFPCCAGKAGAIYRADLVYAPRAALVPPAAPSAPFSTHRSCVSHTSAGDTLEQRRSPRRPFAAAMMGCDTLPALSSAIAAEVAPLAHRPGVSPELAYGPGQPAYTPSRSSPMDACTASTASRTPWRSASPSS
jgi:hypothetical protein